MPSLNKCLLMGNFTRDPEMKYLPTNNTAVTSFGLAINRKWKGKDGKPDGEEVTFLDLEAFGRTAEVINQYFKKGAAIFVEGRLKLDQWTDKEGQKRSKLKVIVESFEFLGGKDDAPKAGTAGGKDPADEF